MKNSGTLENAERGMRNAEPETVSSIVNRQSSIVNGLQVTESEWCRLLTDPVLAAEVLLGYRLDVFQAARLRLYWWCQEVMDTSGYSSGKTIVDWIFCILRLMLIPDQQVGVYFPIGATGRKAFWQYFDTCQSDIFRASLGRVEASDQGGSEVKKGQSRGSEAYQAFFRNGNALYLPAPGFMKKAESQSSLRYNVVVFEEWPKIAQTESGREGLSQLEGRATRPCFNQHSPIFGNHTLWSGTAEKMRHPGAPYFKGFRRAVAAGKPTHALVTFSYKDFSDRPCHTGKSFKEEFRIEGKIRALRDKMSAADWLSEGFGIWTESGAGWFTEEALIAAQANGAKRGVLPEMGRK